MIHFVSLLTAIGIHGSIFSGSFSRSDPVILENQTINISFVAPSANNSRSQDKIKEKKFVEVDKKLGLVKKEKSKKIKKDSKEKKIAGKQTSGRVDKDSKADAASESEPLFNVEYLNNPAPFYPAYAKKKRIEGKVLLDVFVKTDGTAMTVTVKRSSGSSMLDKAALRAVKNWRFIPAKKSGKIIEAKVIVPIEFKII